MSKWGDVEGLAAPATPAVATLEGLPPAVIFLGGRRLRAVPPNRPFPDSHYESLPPEVLFLEGAICGRILQPLFRQSLSDGGQPV